VQRKVREHHQLHGGKSRYEKIPLYFQEYAHRHLSDQEQQEHQLQFQNLVVQQVIESKWVPGVQDYLLCNCKIQRFFLLTGTPQEEIEYILYKLGIHSCFIEIMGAPLQKQEGLKHVLAEYKFSAEECLMIGDSITDYEAAKANNIHFLFRITQENKKFADTMRNWSIKHFEKAPICSGSEAALERETG